MKNMSTEEYKQLWKETIRKCEMESNKKEAKSFISHYFDKRDVLQSKQKQSNYSPFPSEKKWNDILS